jgi:hypothetical protein
MYGKPTDQGDNGMHFKSIFVLANDDEEEIGSIHITVYLSKSKIMIQGNSCVLWHTEHWPHMLGFMIDERPIPPNVIGVQGGENINNANEKKKHEQCKRHYEYGGEK